MLDADHQRLLDDLMVVLTAGVERLDGVCRDVCAEFVADPNRAWSVMVALTSITRDLFLQLCDEDPTRVAEGLARLRDRIEEVLELDQERAR